MELFRPILNWQKAQIEVKRMDKKYRVAKVLHDQRQSANSYKQTFRNKLWI